MPIGLFTLLSLYFLLEEILTILTSHEMYNKLCLNSYYKTTNSFIQVITSLTCCSLITRRNSYQSLCNHCIHVFFHSFLLEFTLDSFSSWINPIVTLRICYCALNCQVTPFNSLYFCRNCKFYPRAYVYFYCKRPLKQCIVD